jgi:5'-deoxynucleotidase YfbR-like HD superfamily hydrolase
MNISDVKRATWVKRWTIVRTLREQNIAEHSFMVAMIAMELTKRIGFPADEGGGLQGALEGELLRWALWHDMAEVFTGDIPTPTKIRLKCAVGDALDGIEDLVAPEVAEIKKSTSDHVIRVVKVADYLEAISFLQDNGGNDDAAEVKHTLMGQLAAYVDGWNSGMRRYYDDILSLAQDIGIDGLDQIPRCS